MGASDNPSVDIERQPGVSEKMPAESTQSVGLKALVARRRQLLKSEQQEKRLVEEANTETWSGLPIADRCIRQEKWDLSMRGKCLASFQTLGAADPHGRDQVLIGVLCSSPLARRGPDGKELAEWSLTDLDAKCPQKASLVLIGRALEHWARKDGAGRAQAASGTIVAVLNPAPTGKAKAIRISFESQLLKLGMCPVFRRCSAKDADGLPCREPFNAAAGGEYCISHERSSHGARQHQQLGTAAAMRPQAAARGAQTARANTVRVSDSRPVASPIVSSSSKLLPPSAAALMILERAEAALAVLAGTQKADVLKVLQDLDAAKLDGSSLRHSRVYERIGELAKDVDAVGAAAKALRRKWRILMDEATAPASEIGTRGGKLPLAKRLRTG